MSKAGLPNNRAKYCRDRTRSIRDRGAGARLRAFRMRETR